MKLKIVPALIVLAIAALIAYSMYSFTIGQNKIIIALGSFLFTAITLLSAIGVSYEKKRTGTNIRALAMLFFFIALLSNIGFVNFPFSQALYIITNGILALIFILIVYFIVGAKQ
tara:strand:+ start:816 stop:1160 length:345 start_codon:yes stop_codon:yes gene_type:complete